jgi:hypothetical protein
MRPPLRDATSCAFAMTQSGQRLITWEGEVSRSWRLPAPVALAHARGHRADFWLAKFVVNEPLKPDLFNHPSTLTDHDYEAQFDLAQARSLL